MWNIFVSHQKTKFIIGVPHSYIEEYRWIMQLFKSITAIHCQYYQQRS